MNSSIALHSVKIIISWFIFLRDDELPYVNSTRITNDDEIWQRVRMPGALILWLTSWNNESDFVKSDYFEEFVDMDKKLIQIQKLLNNGLMHERSIFILNLQAYHTFYLWIQKNWVLDFWRLFQQRSKETRYSFTIFFNSVSVKR